MSSPSADSPVVVADTGPLIALSIVDGVPFLRALFREVVVTPTVASELSAGRGRPGERLLESHPWIQLRAPSSPPDRLLVEELDDGESSAIALAREMDHAVLLMDERRGRRLARIAYGLKVRGSLGILVDARRAGLIGPLSSVMARLMAGGIHLSPVVVEQALRAVGER